jgi:hypothetical protein
MIKHQIKNHNQGIAVLVLIFAALFGFMASRATSALLLSISLVITIAFSIILLSLKSEVWWNIWLSVVFLAAFGPFLDIITGQPINWLIGLGILVFLVFNQFSRYRSRIFSRIVVETKRTTIPVLGSIFLLYNIYFFLQAIRPDGSPWNGLMAFRIAAIGVSAYFLTFSGFRKGMSQEEVVKRLCQFLLIFIITGLIVATYGIFQFLVGFDRLQALGLTDPSVHYLHNQRNLNGGTTIFRIFGTLRRNETMGIFMYLNIVASVVGVRFGIRPKWLPVVNTLLCLIAMLITFSLTSLVLFLLWLILIIITSFSFKSLLKAFMVGIIGLAIILIGNQLMGGIIKTRLAEHVLDTQEGIGRVKMAQNWIAEIGDRPFLLGMFGTGICTGVDEGSLSRIQNLLDKIGFNDGTSIVTCGWSREVYDNWYATHSLEVGLVGLVIFWSIFVLLIISTLPRLAKIWQQPYKSGWIILTLGLFAVWPAGFVGALIWYMPITMYYWSLIALVEIGSYARIVTPDYSPISD